MFIRYRLAVGSKIPAEATLEPEEEFILILLPDLFCPVAGIGSVTVLAVPVSLTVGVTAVQLSAGMPDERLTAAQAKQDGSL